MMYAYICEDLFIDAYEYIEDCMYLYVERYMPYRKGRNTSALVYTSMFGQSFINLYI
jgi:hypothetical protein